MKKILLILALALPMMVAAQNNTVKWKYAELIGTTKAMSTKIALSIDYGQIKDESGKIETFNTMIDAMNYMSEQGWEFVQAYVVGGKTGDVYHWIIKHN
jgi:hypothetical protein